MWTELNGNTSPCTCNTEWKTCTLKCASICENTVSVINHNHTCWLNCAPSHKISSFLLTNATNPTLIAVFFSRPLTHGLKEHKPTHFLAILITTCLFFSFLLVVLTSRMVFFVKLFTWKGQCAEIKKVLQASLCEFVQLCRAKKNCRKRTTQISWPTARQQKKKTWRGCYLSQHFLSVKHHFFSFSETPTWLINCKTKFGTISATSQRTHRVTQIAWRCKYLSFLLSSSVCRSNKISKMP